MKKVVLLALAGVLAMPSLASAEGDWKSCAALVGPVLENAKIGKFKRGKKLDVTIEYLDEFGFTTVDADGIHWSWNGKTINGGMKYPSQYWGEMYPLYLIGKTMRVRVHVHNRSKRRIKKVRVVAMHEYLNIFGGDGENLPGNSTAAWFIPNLKRNQTKTFEFSYYIPKGTSPGLDQTHVVLTKCKNPKKKCCSKQRLLANLPQAGVFCPPD